MEYPFTVVGLSVAGVAAAFEMVPEGIRPCLLEPTLELATRDLTEVGATPRNEAPEDAAEWEYAATRDLAGAGVSIREFDGGRISVDDQGLVCLSLRTEREIFGRTRATGPSILCAAAVVFAPIGRLPELPAWIAGDGPRPRGVFSDTTASGYFFKGQRVAVLGDGPWALAQALYLVGCGVEVICLADDRVARPSGPVHRSRWLERLGAVPRQAHLERLLLDPDGVLTGVWLETGGIRSLLPVQGLCFAREPVPDWRVFGGRKAAQGLIDARKLYLAGRAAGVAYGDDRAMWESGAAAGRRAMVDQLRR